MVARAKLRIFDSDDDPKEALRKALGEMSSLEIFHNQVLVGVYLGKSKSKGGILYTEKHMQENRFQSKVGLVLKLGPLAFKDDEVNGAFFGGLTPKEDEWVFFRPGDGMELYAVEDASSEGVSCRIFRDVSIMGRVSDPGMLW